MQGSSSSYQRLDYRLKPVSDVLSTTPMSKSLSEPSSAPRSTIPPSGLRKYWTPSYCDYSTMSPICSCTRRLSSSKSIDSSEANEFISASRFVTNAIEGSILSSIICGLMGEIPVFLKPFWMLYVDNALRNAKQDLLTEIFFLCRLF
jgi:hypothetical protein